MCRMLGYLGRARALSTLLDDPPHSLLVQSYKAKELEGAVVNADGWGAAWYAAEDPEPIVYRSTLPIWGDVNRTHIGRAARSTSLLAAVRSATDPLSISAANTQPFAHGSMTFLHNGYIRDFPSTLLRPMREALSPETYARVEGNTDSEHVFAALVDAVSGSLDDAIRTTTERILSLARAADTRALLTLIVSDGEVMVGARTAVNGNPPSLYLREDDDGVTLASEPLDESRSWRAVPPKTLVVAARGAPFRQEELS